MISAFSKGYRLTENILYLNTAKNASDFFLTEFEKNKILYRTFKNGIPKLNAYLEDYAYLANGVLDLFEITGEKKYLTFASNLSDYMVKHFWDDSSNSFFFTSDIHEKLIVRPKSNYDLSMPSGNSVASNVLLRLYHILQNKKFLDISTKILEHQGPLAAENPFAFGYLLNVLYLYTQTPTEITILNDKNSDLITQLNRKFIPESIMVLLRDEQALKELSSCLFFSGKKFEPSQTSVFVCKNFTCSLPLLNFEDIENDL